MRYLVEGSHQIEPVDFKERAEKVGIEDDERATQAFTLPAA